MVDRDVTVDFNADVSSYTASTTQAIALTKEYTAELDNMVGSVAKVGNAMSTGLVDSMAKLMRANEAGTAAAAAYQQQLSVLEGAVEVTGGSFGKLEGQVKRLAREMPIGIGGAVRQFETLQKVGVPTERVAGLAKAFTQLEGATGESGAALAQMGVQFSRTFNNQGLRGIQNLNDSLVKTSREFGASATGVMSFANAIAPMAKQAGMAQTEVIGMATAFSRVGEDGYRAANALTKMMTDMDRAVREGSSEMTTYANIVNKTRQEFTDLYKSDPAEAFNQIFDALSKAGPDGIRMLESIGLEGTRTMRSIQAVVQSGGTRQTITEAQEAYGGGSTAQAAEKAFGGLNDQMTKLGETMSQTVAAAGTPFIGFLEDVARVATSVAGIFEGLANNEGLQTLVSIGGTLGIAGAAAGGITAAGTALGIGKGILGSTGGPGRSAAGFLANNRGKLLAAGAGGLALSGMGGGGVGMMLPLLAMSFLGGSNPLTRGLGNAGRVLTEAFTTNFGMAAAQPLSDIAEGKDPVRRSRYSGAYRVARDIQGPNATWRDRMSLQRRYMLGNQDAFVRDIDKIQGAIRDQRITPGQGADLLRRVDWDEPMSRTAAMRRGGMTAMRAAGYGFGGMAMGAGRGLMAMMGGVPGMALMGATTLGFMGYESSQRQREQERQVAERQEAGDTTSALNDLRTALGIATVAAHDFSDALKSSTGEIEVNTTMAEALSVTEQEFLAGAGKTSVLGFQGTAEQQAAQAQALLGPGADLAMTEAIVADLVAANQGDRETLDQVLGILGGGGGGITAAAGIQAGQGGATIGDFANAPGGRENPLSQMLSITEDQMVQVDQMADAMNQTYQQALQVGGVGAVAEAKEAAASGLADAISAEMDEVRAEFGGEADARDMGRRQIQSFERYAQQGLGLQGDEAKEFVKVASESGVDAAMEYYTSETQSGKQWAEASAQADEETRSLLQNLFETQTGVFDELLPVLGELKDTNLTTQEFLEANRGALNATETAVLEALAQPGNVGAQITGGQALAAEVLNAPDAMTALADLQARRGEAGVGTAERALLDQADAEARMARNRQRMSMTSVGANRDIIEQGQAVIATMAQEGGYSADEGIAMQQRQDLEAMLDARESEKQFMIQRLTQQREYNVSRTRMIDQFEIAMTRQEDAFYRQRGYAQEAFQRQMAYSEADYYRNRERAIADFNRSMARAQQDYRISVRRAEEDFQLSRARAFEDYNLGIIREAEDWSISMQRIAEDTAASFMDPFTRVGPEQTWSTGGLLRNLERQAELAQEQLATLDELRERGLSQGAIDTLNLADPSMARQVSRMGGMSAEEIAQLNAASGERMGIAEGYMDEDKNLRRQEEDRKKSLERQAEDFQKSMDRSAADFRKSLRRGERDFNRSLARNREDFNRQLARSWEDFQIQRARAQEEFTISMDQQLTEFSISVANAREDHERQLGYMEADLKRSGEQIHGDYQDIADAYMDMVSGDAEAYKKVTTDTVIEMRDILSSEMSNIPGDVKNALGPLAWMFGLEDFDAAKFQKWMDAYARAINTGLNAQGAERFANRVAEYGNRGYPRATGGAGEGDVGYFPAPPAGMMLPPGSYTFSRGSSAHGYSAIDLGTGPNGTGVPIFAPWDGSLSNKGYAANSYGNFARLTGAGREVLIAHMSRFAPGGAKKRGDVIGYVGSTGKSSGPHLHAEVGPPGFPGAGSPWRTENYLKYDTGGILPHGGGAVNLSGKPEAIINNEQWKALRHLGEEIGRLNAGVTMDPRGMGIVGEVIGRHLDAWESKAARVSGYAVAGHPTSTVQTYDHSTQVTGPIQVVSNDPVDMGRKIAGRSRRRRAFQPIGGGR